jgi:hypothetical protein
MQSMSRLQIAGILAWMIVASTALIAAGLNSWDPWLQLATGVAVLISATLIAPNYFGWRNPRGHH